MACTSVGGRSWYSTGAALFAGAVEKIGDELRLDFGAAQIRASAERANVGIVLPPNCTAIALVPAK